MADNERELSFTVDSRLLEELGENLVTRNHVALAELIKNAYDADATHVDIEFSNARVQATDEVSEIRVVDNGVGMSFAEVRDNWMQVATTDKLNNPTTEIYGREKAGSKGIGRFASQRLAHEIEIEATAYLQEEDRYERTVMDINWEDYVGDEKIESVTQSATVTTLDEDEEPETGVTLRLKNLRDSWTQQDFNTLRRNVVTLSVVEPKRRDGAEKEDPGFDIEFNAPEFDKGEGALKEQVHDAGWGTLEGKFISDGSIELTLDGKLIGTETYGLEKNVSGLAGTVFRISYIPLKKEHFRDKQTLSLSGAREVLENHGGVRVYKGGFRVYSYGGPGDDWLGINEYQSSRKGRPDDALLNARLRRGRVNNSRFHSVKERFLRSEDAVTAAGGGRQRVK
ncbi:ATP-binding protein, partial [Halorubrum ezzemoulense]|uniref:ATP-binding protein n=1 Tax=Halorubrum ezzemoulense TaxID=337243 RepID=UPI00232FD958